MQSLAVVRAHSVQRWLLQPSRGAEEMRGWFDMTAPPLLPQHPLMQRRQPLLLPSPPLTLLSQMRVAIHHPA